MDNSILLTKLFMPKLPSDTVKRPQLLNRLTEGLARNVPLTLLSAPAGYGKSTILAQWIASSLRKAAWISLDEHDNNQQRFWQYCVTGLQGIVSDWEGQNLAELLELLKQDDQRQFLTALVNTIVSWNQPLMLVLDDYHSISSQAIHEGVNFLIEHMPDSMHLVIATRTDPPLRINRLRGRGQVTEIRVADLRFSLDEVGDYLNNLMKLQVNETDLDALENRTEGWIAGLHLAAMSMQGLQDVHGFVQDFTGSQYLVLEYLVEEVLQRQQESVQKLLLETSILQRMCAPLCDMVTGSSDSQHLLADLYHQNLFVIPLDGEHYWYRYHHLFAEFLKSHLKRMRPADIPELHRRASLWYQANGYSEEALFHASAIPDYTLISRLVVDNWRKIYHTGDLYTARKWLESMPIDTLCKSPALRVAYCWTIFIQGDYSRIAQLLDGIESIFKQMVDKGDFPAEHPEYHIIMQQVILLRTIVLRHSGDATTAIAMIKELLPSIEQIRTTLGQKYADMGFTAWYSQLGYAYVAAHDLERAEESLSKVGAHARACGNYFALAHATMELARIVASQKRLEQAEQICRTELRFADQAGTAEMPAFCLIHLALADILRARGSLETAESYLDEGLKTAKRNGHEFYLAQGYLIAARLHHALGKTSLVLEDMLSAEQIATSIHNRILDEAISKTRAQVEGTALAEDSDRTKPLVEQLSERELEVLRLICQGKSNQEIADALFVSLNTIKRHVNNLYGKMGVSRRSQAIHEAHLWGYR